MTVRVTTGGDRRVTADGDVRQSYPFDTGITGTLDATEGADIAAFDASSISTKFETTEAPDVFNGQGDYPHGSLAATEAKDVAAFAADVTGFVGPLNATEAADVAAIAGTVSAPPAVALNGHASASTTNSATLSASLSTASGNLVVAIVQTNTGAYSKAFPAVVLTDAGNKVPDWKLQYEFVVANNVSVQVWWGVASGGAMSSDSITATFQESQTKTNLIVFGVDNANTSRPFDTSKTTFPQSLKSGGGFGTHAAPNAFNSNCAAGMAVVLYGTDSSNAPNSPSSGYTTIEVTAANPNIGCAYKVFASALSAEAPDMGTIGSSGVTAMGFVIAGFTQTNCTNKPFLPLLSGVNNAASSSTGNTIAANITTAMDGGLIFAFVARNSNATVTSLSDTGNQVINWTKYATINNGTTISVDVWYGTPVSKMTNHTITAVLSASAALRSIILCHVTGVDTSAPLDPNLSMPATNTGSGFTSAMTTGAATSNTPNITALAVIGTQARSSPTGQPSPTVPISGEDTGGGDVAVSLEFRTTALSSTAYTLAGTGGGDWFGSIIALAPEPPPHGPMATTEAKDVASFHVALPIDGHMTPNEAPDVLGWNVVVPPIGVANMTEHADIFDWNVFVPPFGPMAAVETPDAMTALGAPIPPLGLDAHATASAAADSGDGVASADVTITTTYIDTVIVVGVASGGFWINSDVASVTDTTGLVWKRRMKRLVSANTLNGQGHCYFEVWWAHKPLPGPTTISVNLTQPGGAVVLDAIAVKGANTETPFDYHTASGWFVDNYGGALFSVSGNIHIGNPNAFVYANVDKTFSYMYHSGDDEFTDTTIAPTWTFLTRSKANEHSGSQVNLASGYRTFDTQQFGTVDSWFGPDISHISDRQLWLDNIVGYSEPGSSDEIRWFFDGTGARVSEQFDTGQNNTTMDFRTYTPGSVVCVAVLIQSSFGARVAGIVDTDGDTSWVRRSLVTDASGAVSLEVWWAKKEEVFNGTLTIVGDGNTHGGDLFNAIGFAVYGADAFNRGEIWDGNISLPATNHGDNSAYDQTVGPFSSLNDNVLVLGIGANIDPADENDGLQGKQRPPYLVLPPPGSLSSDGIPNYNISLEYVFSPTTVEDATAAFDISPEPPLWFMIADIMPVGLPSPPHGPWHSTDAKDTTGNNGDYEPIGIDTNGWIGHPENNYALAATEAKDRATNSGAFEPLFDENGWVGYIPAFCEFAIPELDDIMSLKHWVLGPTTILAQMYATDTSDYLGFNGPTTYYTTSDSTGDRRARITVTTNADIERPDLTGPGDATLLVDGTNDGILLKNTQVVTTYIRFDFGSARRINEIKAYQNGPSAQPGTWVWQASNDATAWDTLSAPFTFNAGNGGSVLGDISSNVTPYRYYQVIQSSFTGTLNDSPVLREFEFKVEGVGAQIVATEPHDWLAGNGLVIPEADPLPARQRRVLFTT